MEHPENHPDYKGLQVNSGVSSQPSVNPYRRPVARRRLLTPGEYVEGILKGNVTVLGQAVTLVESTVDAHQQIAQEVIEKCLPYTGHSRRIGITGCRQVYFDRCLWSPRPQAGWQTRRTRHRPLERAYSGFDPRR